MREKCLRRDNKAILKGKVEGAEAVAKKMMEEGAGPIEVMDNGCVLAIEKAGEMLQSSSLFRS